MGEGGLGKEGLPDAIPDNGLQRAVLHQGSTQQLSAVPAAVATEPTSRATALVSDNIRQQLPPVTPREHDL